MTVVVILFKSILAAIINGHVSEHWFHPLTLQTKIKKLFEIELIMLITLMIGTKESGYIQPSLLLRILRILSAGVMILPGVKQDLTLSRYYSNALCHSYCSISLFLFPILFSLPFSFFLLFFPLLSCFFVFLSPSFFLLLCWSFYFLCSFSFCLSLPDYSIGNH